MHTLTQAHTKNVRLLCSGLVLDAQGNQCLMLVMATLTWKAGEAPSLLPYLPLSPLDSMPHTAQDGHLKVRHIMSPSALTL